MLYSKISLELQELSWVTNTELALIPSYVFFVLKKNFYRKAHRRKKILIFNFTQVISNKADF